MAAGYSAMLLAVSYQIVDVWKYRQWAQPFVWIGINPITIYLIHNLVDIDAIAKRFIGGDLSALYLGSYGLLATSLVSMAITFGIARFLYVRGIFLRV